MIYNLKLSIYSNELQLSYYEDGITYKTEEEKENDKTIEQYFQNDKPNTNDTSEIDTAFEQWFKTNKTVLNPFDNTEVVEVEEFTNNADNLRRSVARTKQTIYEYTRANIWEYFATFTFEDDYRYDYQECKKRFSKFMNNFKNRYCEDLQYIAVPEQHKDGAWHFHALISGNIREYLADGFHKGRFILTKYKLGINEIEPVKDTHKVSMYITKYITKDMLAGMKNSQRFLVSKGLKKAETMKIMLPEGMSIIEFIENNFPEYEITYSKYYETDSCYGHNANYIQLGMIND